MTITFVRHGQSVANEKKICQGHFDTDLSELGRNQAKIVAKRLKEESFDYMYSSDLKRAYSTALEINKYHGFTIRQDFNL